MKDAALLNSHTVEDLLCCLSDLFNAGSETTSSTIRWAIYFLAKYPEVQARVQKEIDSVVPRDVLPSIQQKNRCAFNQFPYQCISYSVIPL